MLERFHLRAMTLLLVAVASFTCGPTIKNEFIDMSYPEQARAIPAHDWELSVAATLVPTLVVGYAAPAAAGSCIEEIVARAGELDHMWSFGQCLASALPAAGTSNDADAGASVDAGAALPPADAGAAAPAADAGQVTQDGALDAGTRGTSVSPVPTGNAELEQWMTCARQSFPWIGHGQLTVPCAATLSSADRLEVTLALLETSEAAFGYYLSAFGYGRQSAPLTDPMKQAMVAAIGQSVRLLKADPGPQPPHGKARRELPFLALSGGAANGAFTAGYLHAMFTLREAALAAGDVADAQKRPIDLGYRFGGATGTSVGTLVGTLADLYFTDQPNPPPPELGIALRDCLGASAPHSPRDIQACALLKLRKYFEVSEWDLLCAEDGYFLDLFKTRENALRFDPMRHNIVEPFFASFGPWVTHNDFLRIVMVADLNQNVVLGLDERACLLPGMNRGKCLEEAVLASVSEPTFAPPVPVVYSGLRGPVGESGRWLDGGVRTGTPTARGVPMTADRILAISTNRSEGVPSAGSDCGFAVLLESVDALVAQTRQWELAHTGLYREARRDRGCRLGREVNAPFYCPTASATAAPYIGLQGDLKAVFPPLDVAPQELFAAGYTFDPYVMKGLFAWGQKTFLDGRSVIFQWLRWKVLLDLENPSTGSATYREAVRQYASQVGQVVDSYAHVTTSELDEHRKQRHDEVKDHMDTCHK
jgi:hypothetical protein